MYNDFGPEGEGEYQIIENRWKSFSSICKRSGKHTERGRGRKRQERRNRERGSRKTRAKQIETLVMVNVCAYIRADIDYSAVCVQDWEGEG